MHPAEMQLDEDPQTASLLFQLVNLIVENQISQPKAVQELYSKLPQGQLMQSMKGMEMPTNEWTHTNQLARDLI